MADTVYRQLFGIIVNEELKPGDRLTVDQLSRQFEVSHTPVRQALLRLQSDGFVSNKPNTGFRVSEQPTHKELCDNLERRIVIESSFIDRAVDHADESTFRDMEDSLKTMTLLLAADDFDIARFYKADMLFHSAIAKAAGNKAGSEMLIKLFCHSATYQLTHPAKTPFDDLAEHTEIFQAIKAGSKLQANAKMKVHLRTSIQGVQEFE